MRGIMRSPGVITTSEQDSLFKHSYINVLSTFTTVKSAS